MPKYDHPDLGDVADHAYIKATITAVQSEADTADIEGDGISGAGVPIFYHCEPDSEERSNGAIEGAAGGFAVDDEVYIMCEGSAGSYTPVRIIGFVDGIKACSWEPWDSSDEPDLCKNNVWRVQIGGVWLDCPIDFEDEEFTDTQTLSMNNGVLSGSVLSSVGAPGSGGANVVVICQDEESLPSEEVATLKIKITADAMATDPLFYTSFVELYVETEDGDQDFALAYGNRFVIDVWDFIDLSAQTGEEEIEIDLATYGLTGKIVDITIRAFANGSTGNTANFTCDYINFK